MDSSILPEKGWTREQPSSQPYRYGIIRDLDDEDTEEEILRYFTTNNGQRLQKATRKKREGSR